MITQEFEAVVHDFKSAVTTAFGQFYPDFEFGSMLCEKREGKAFLMSCAKHGANSVDGLFVKNIKQKADHEFYIVFILNETESEVLIKLEAYT